MKIKILFEIIDGEELALIGAFTSTENLDNATRARQDLPHRFPRQWEIHEVELDQANFQFVL
jgi:hypothetical protein